MVSIVVGGLVIVKKVTDKHINEIPSSHSQYEIQKIADCQTAHLLRRILSMWVQGGTIKLSS